MVVQIENKYPMMFALLDLFRNVWKKAAMPICANDQPIDTMRSKTFEVLVKNGVPRINVPMR